MYKILTYPVVVICGTNASGKSSLGIKLAKKYNGEIISADSRQIIRGFDLCCGKVSDEEKKIVPHHMIDICDIGDTFSVSDYQKQVYELIPQIVKRNKMPFIVGGTGLYIDAVIKGYNFYDEDINYNYREELNNKSIQDLQAMLSETATEYLKYNNSDFNNKRRLIRLIEKESNGNPILPSNKALFNTLQIGVTWSKEMLFKRIDDRLAMRINQGMIDEVRDYLKNGGSFENLYKLGLEYRYIAWYLQGKYSSIEEFLNEMSQAIKKYAKQQIKWFKRNVTIQWIDMTQDYFSEACDLIDMFMKNGQLNKPGDIGCCRSGRG